MSDDEARRRKHIEHFIGMLDQGKHVHMSDTEMRWLLAGALPPKSASASTPARPPLPIEAKRRTTVTTVIEDDIEDDPAPVPVSKQKGDGGEECDPDLDDDCVRDDD